MKLRVERSWMGATGLSSVDWFFDLGLLLEVYVDSVWLEPLRIWFVSEVGLETETRPMEEETFSPKQVAEVVRCHHEWNKQENHFDHGWVMHGYEAFRNMLKTAFLKTEVHC